MRDITLKQLRAISAIMRTGKVLSAAKELSVTPPAVTLQLKHLEESTGLTLFDRTRNGLRPTDAGRLLLETAVRIETALEECSENLLAMRGLAGGRVTVGVVSTAKYFAPRLIAAFMNDHPQIELRLWVGNRTETIRSLRDYGVDIAFMGRPPKDIAVEQSAFGSHPHVIIAPPDHRLVGRRRIRREDLASEYFLVREEGSGTRALFEDFFSGVEVRRPRIRIEIGSNETIKQAVMAGLGLALISAHTIEAEVTAGRLRTLNVPGLPIVRKWYLVRRTDKTLGPAGVAFWRYVEREGRRFLPEIAR
jgi:LysR family transcriptional regulator, low CO2-responsive transcriptional regulator